MVYTINIRKYLDIQYIYKYKTKRFINVLMQLTADVKILPVLVFIKNANVLTRVTDLNT